MVPWLLLVTLNPCSLSLSCSFKVKKRVIASQRLEDGDVGRGLWHHFKFSFTSFLVPFFFLFDCLVSSPKLWNFELVEVCNMGCCLRIIFSCISPSWTTHLCIEQLLSSCIGANLSLYLRMSLYLSSRGYEHVFAAKTALVWLWAFEYAAEILLGKVMYTLWLNRKILIDYAHLVSWRLLVLDWIACEYGFAFARTS